MRRRLAAYRMTRAGGALMFVLGAAVIVLLLGPHHDETPAFIVIVVGVAMLLGGGISSSRGALRPSLSERRRQFHPERRPVDELTDQQAEAEAWRREREAYEERHRQQGNDPGR